MANAMVNNPFNEALGKGFRRQQNRNRQAHGARTRRRVGSLQPHRPRRRRFGRHHAQGPPRILHQEHRLPCQSHHRRLPQTLLHPPRLGGLWEMVCNDSDGACYGPEEVERASEMRAIETLLITDDLYRNEEVETRQRYTSLVKSVKEGGGKALVYSTMHVSAPQLALLTGVAAILRFPLPHLQLQPQVLIPG
ncbi:hypothetical protein VNO78_17751 [Psophocarpus tetragonolobus]|uniref:eRF1 domain-containing protein n=1 Tax=Psophocarpus tetragonolobus TaxID=3891 RepID=A0AAN9SJD3_PSOTE